jgi:hypothetical protein
VQENEIKPVPQTCKLKALVVEKMVKKIIRVFRKNLKDMFLKRYTIAYYRWNFETLRQKTKEFFTQPIFSCPEQFYLANEIAFFTLIHNTYLNKPLKGIKDCEITKVYENVFKEHPSKANLKLFFGSQVVKGLWQGPSFR